MSQDGVQIKDQMDCSFRSCLVFGVSVASPLHRKILERKFGVLHPDGWYAQYFNYWWAGRHQLFTSIILEYMLWPPAKCNLPQLPQGYRSKKLWGAVKPLASLQPYSSSRSSYHGNGILMYLCAFCY